LFKKQKQQTTRSSNINTESEENKKFIDFPNQSLQQIISKN
jgi:hypothetical protein